MNYQQLEILLLVNIKFYKVIINPPEVMVRWRKNSWEPAVLITFMKGTSLSILSYPWLFEGERWFQGVNSQG